MGATVEQPAPRRSRWLGAAFAAVVVGPNLPTALLPTYRDEFGTSSLGLSLLFSTYLFVLVPLLLVFGLRQLPARAARPAALAALAVTAAADLVLWHADTMGQALIGRALSGIAVGLATVAIAVLVVREIGDRGRGVVASGSVLGSMVGVAAAVLAAALGFATWVYPVHVVLVLALIPAILVLIPAATARPRTEAATLRTVPTPGWPPLRYRWSALAAGALCWSLPGVVIGLLPALLRDRLGPEAVVLSTAPVLVFLGGSWAISVLAPRIPLLRDHPVAVGSCAGAVGALLLVVAAQTGQVLPAYLGCIIGAAAPALAYRGGLEMFTRGAGGRVGALTAAYTGLSYGLGTVVVVGAGALGSIAGGTAVAVTVAAGILAIGGTMAGATVIGIGVHAVRRTAVAG